MRKAGDWAVPGLYRRKSASCHLLETWCRQLSSLQRAKEHRRFAGARKAVGVKVVDDPSYKWDHEKQTDYSSFIRSSMREEVWVYPHHARVERERQAATAAQALTCQPGFHGGDFGRVAIDERTCSKLCKEGQLCQAVEALEILVQQASHVSISLLYRILKLCTLQKNLVLGRRVHALTIKTGYESDTFLANRLICMYASQGMLEEASQVLNQVAEPDVYMWASIILAHARCGQPRQAIQLYKQMRESTVKPDYRIFVATLTACATAMDLATGKEVHSDLLGSDLDLGHVFLGSCLVNMYSKCGSLIDARSLFDKLPAKNVVTWNCMIAGYAQHGLGHEALSLYETMQRDGTVPTQFTFSCLLKVCTSVGDLSSGKQVHADVVANGSGCNLFIGNTLVDMYAKCGSLDDARTVFDTLQTRDVVTWNAMIAGYALHGLGKEACKLYIAMQEYSIVPDHVTFMTVLKACGRIPDLQEGKRIHGHIQAVGLEGHGFVMNALIDMYGKCGSMVDARHIFDRMTSKDVMTWNAILTGYVQNGFAHEALRLYDSMHQQGVVANKVTLVNVLRACGTVGFLQKGKHIHACLEGMKLEKDVFVGTALIDMYAKCGCVWDARTVFDNLPIRDVVVWNAMISGYAENESENEALKLYKCMLLEGVAPDKVTFVSILKACSSIGAVQEGERVHAHIWERGYQSDSFVGGSLMNMYVKCGNLAAAHTVFNKLSKKNVVAWNILIAGYVQQMLGQEALDLFNTMQQEGVAPDAVTLVSILKTCGSMQAIKEGKQVHALILDRGLGTDLFVASTLMDMYAKWGCLEDAREVFDRLHNRDVVTWNAMLAAYLRQGLGQEAVKLYFTMQQTDVAPNNVTYASILKACGSVGAIQDGQQIHAQIVESGTEADLSISNALIDMYATCGRLEDARNIFDRLSTKDAGTWSAMIVGYSQQGVHQEALKLYKAMPQNIPADETTYVGILKACGNVGAIQEGKQIHAQIVARGIETDGFIATALIDMYAKCGSMQQAQAVFDALPPTRDVVAWTALIHGYGQHNDCKAAMLCFEQMRQQGVVPDAATFTSLLVACSHVSMVNEGEQYFRMMTEQCHIVPTVEHYTCMVDLLSRAGRLDEAHTLLLSMPFHPHTAGWRSLLNGCRSYGNMELGKLCFDRLAQLEPEQAAGYVLMSNIYADSGCWEDVEMIQNLRRSAGAQKKPAMASIEIDKQVHEFIVGDKTFSGTDAVYGKVRTLTEQMKAAGHVPETDLVLKPLSEKDKEDALCGHAEKLAIAFGLLHTPEGSELLIVKNLRMCNDCHSATKVLSRMEGRDIVVRDAHRVHRFKDGVCSCGDHH